VLQSIKTNLQYTEKLIGHGFIKDREVGTNPDKGNEPRNRGVQGKETQ
jgi:hypothetical protein